MNAQITDGILDFQVTAGARGAQAPRPPRVIWHRLVRKNAICCQPIFRKYFWEQMAFFWPISERNPHAMGHLCLPGKTHEFPHFLPRKNAKIFAIRAGFPAAAPRPLKLGSLDDIK